MLSNCVMRFESSCAGPRAAVRLRAPRFSRRFVGGGEGRGRDGKAEGLGGLAVERTASTSCVGATLYRWRRGCDRGNGPHMLAQWQTKAGDAPALAAGASLLLEHALLEKPSELARLGEPVVMGTVGFRFRCASLFRDYLKILMVGLDLFTTLMRTHVILLLEGGGRQTVRPKPLRHMEKDRGPS